MQVSVEASGAIERKLTVTVPASEIEQEVSKRLNDLMRKSRLPGFRPGKVPPNLIRQRFGGQVFNEVANDTINSSYREAIEQEKIVAAGLLSIEPEKLATGQDLKYVATIEIFPQISSPTLAGQTISRPACEVTTEDIDRTFEDIRKRNAIFTEKPDQAETSDRITIDFSGSIDGEIFAGGSAEDHVFILGEGRMLPQFEEGVLGQKQGCQNTYKVNFPEDYHGRDIAGKTAEFTVTIKKVEQQTLPDDTELIAAMEFTEDIAKLRQEIENNLQLELHNRIRVTLRDRVMDKLQEINPIEIPKALLEEEIDRSVQSVEAEFKQRGLPQIDIKRELYTDQARKRVTQGLILREIIESGKIVVGADLVRARIDRMAQSYQDPESFVKLHYEDKQRLHQIESVILEERVIEKVLESATIEDEKISFKEFMAPAQPQNAVAD